MDSTRTRPPTGRPAGASALAGELGVEVVFGLPGVHSLAAWDALRTSPIRVVGVRQRAGRGLCRRQLGAGDRCAGGQSRPMTTTSATIAGALPILLSGALIFGARNIRPDSGDPDFA